MTNLTLIRLRFDYIADTAVRRGGFMQIVEPPTAVSHPTHYTLLTQEMTAFPVRGLMQRIDDCDPKMKLDQANIYSKSRPKRISRDVVLPY